MADRLTIARPYARAAFEEARKNGGLAPWSEALQAAAIVVKDPRVANLLDNPRVTPEQLAGLVDGIAAAPLGEHGANFVRTLAHNHRLGYLPEIAELFDTFKDDAEGVVDVTVTSAAALDEAQRRSLSTALQRRLRRKVRLHCDIDPALIGGATLRAGDLVIDGSLRTRLERIAYELTA
ncbi:MAG: F0F1 ATP synthase subunit delta [Gammaproteobacteria bacterium]|nr:F0F1 ATP synthase subunit delta [Gammaproteobacteria bacterium]MBV9724446.1 F0F1 ATP synthase subunit delta [Gammaproteobacteria bacterium]